MNKKLKNPVVWIPLVVAVAFVCGMLCSKGLFTADSSNGSNSKLSTLLNIIGHEYVDAVDTDSLMEEMYPQLLSGLDPHSVYIKAEDLEAVNSELEGSFSGIGITFNMLNDSINVLEVLSGGPSEKVGLMAGDRIVTINDSVASGKKWSNEEVMSWLRGEAGTKVRLGIKRSTSSELLPFEVTRGPIPVTSIDAAYMLDDVTGYVRVNKFGRTTYDEFYTEMVKLRGAGAKKYVVDLRGNGGGFMEMAVMMANEFLPAGQLIVATHGRDESAESAAVSDGAGTFQDAELVVLLDEFSASASEIFAGAIQDHDRGLVMGRRSFGKGLVQRQMELPDGSAVRLTIARYYTPSGRCIQKTYTHGENQDYAREILDRYNSGEVFNGDSIKHDEHLVFKTDGGRTVYGGGGIMPDIFVPNDTAEITSYYLNVLNKGLLQKFSFDFTDRHRAALKQSGGVTAMLKVLPSDEELLLEFVDYAKANGVPARWYYINISSNLIVNDLKALIARDVFGTSAFYKVNNLTDPTVVRAVRELRNGNTRFPVGMKKEGPTALMPWRHNYFRNIPWTNNLYAVK